MNEESLLTPTNKTDAARAQARRMLILMEAVVGTASSLMVALRANEYTAEYRAALETALGAVQHGIVVCAASGDVSIREIVRHRDQLKPV